MKRLGLALFVALLYLPALGDSSSGTHPDESYYLGISAEMDARGEWLTPTIDDVPTWYKPPLLYWAERVGYRLLGRGFLAGRLPAAIAAIGLALLTGALARRLYGERAGTLAALLVATTFGFLRFGRMAMMDAPMALALTAAAYGAFRAAEEGRAAQLLWAGVGAGAATLLKGPVGAVLVLLIAGGYLAFRAPRLLASRFTAGAFALGAAIALPWYVASLARHGRAFYEFFVVSQNVDRFRAPWRFGGPVGQATLLVGFVVFLLPWTFLAAGGLSRRRLAEPGLLLPLLWIGAVLLVFTVPALKWPHYGLACTPAAMLLASRAAPPRWARIATALVLAALATAALLALRWPLPVRAAAALAGAGALLAGAAGFVLRERIATGAVAAGAAATLALTIVIPAVNPPVVPDGVPAALAGRPLFVYDAIPGVFTLGAGRPVRRAWTIDDATDALDRGGALIVAEPALARLPQHYRARIATLARWRHVPGYLPADAVWRSWRGRDPSLLFEGMLAVALPLPTSAAR